MPEGSACEPHRDVASSTADEDSSHRSFVAKNAPQDDTRLSFGPRNDTRSKGAQSKKGKVTQLRSIFLKARR
jgi:hypothetical protein